MEQDELHITLVQPDVQWEDHAANLNHLSELLSVTEQTDIILLPEMFATGFSMHPERLAEQMDGESIKWMRDQAKTHNAAVVGSLIIEEGGNYFNRLLWMTPNGAFEHYDKCHLFSFANEEEHYTAGKHRLIVDWKGWKICPLICYDLRFPVWSRNQDWSSRSADPVYDLLLYVANWPAVRSKAWTNLLEARAHENQCYVAGVNRIGNDGNAIPHSGNSALYNPKGELLSDIALNEESVKTFAITKSELKGFREKFTAWKDADDFQLFT